MYEVTNCASYNHEIPPPIDPARGLVPIGPAYRVWDVYEGTADRRWRVTELPNGGVMVNTDPLDDSYVAVYADDQFMANLVTESRMLGDYLGVGRYVLQDCM